MSETVILFRPVGKRELTLIAESKYSRFPARLPEQPIFYPVLNEECATQIAHDWNAKRNSDRIGYVTRLAVKKCYLDRYETKCVGGRTHAEYWIPADEFELFNDNIVGPIEVVSDFREEGRKLRSISYEEVEFIICRDLVTCDLGAGAGPDQDTCCFYRKGP